MKIDTAQQISTAALDHTHGNPAAAPDKIDEEARRAKVEAIREQLASGTYSISGKDVASKILSILKG